MYVRYRNHFPVVQFENQAYIWNPHGTGKVFKIIWGAAGAPIFFIAAEGGGFHRPEWGVPGASNMGRPRPPILFCFTAAEGCGFPNAAPEAPLPRRAREGGGGCFASLYYNTALGVSVRSL